MMKRIIIVVVVAGLFFKVAHAAIDGDRLYRAVKKRSLARVHKLIAKGGRFDSCAEKERQILVAAVQSGDVDIVVRVLAAGAYQLVNLSDEQGRRVIDEAIDVGNMAVVDQLLNVGTQPTLYALKAVVKSGDAVRVSRFLVKYPNRLWCESVESGGKAFCQDKLQELLLLARDKGHDGVAKIIESEIMRRQSYMWRFWRSVWG